MSKRIMPLRPFNLGDGRVGEPGRAVEVADHIAHAAHAFGNAQILTDEEAAEAAAAPSPPEGAEEPTAQDRDPKARRR